MTHKMLSGAIENAQKKVESRNFQARKYVLEYDDVMNKQREIIYDQRRQVLDGRGPKGIIMQHDSTAIGHPPSTAPWGRRGTSTSPSCGAAEVRFRGLYFPKYAVRSSRSAPPADG